MTGFDVAALPRFATKMSIVQYYIPFITYHVLNVSHKEGAASNPY